MNTQQATPAAAVPTTASSVPGERKAHYARLMEGGWGLWIEGAKPAAGERVLATRKDGKCHHEVVATVVRTLRRGGVDVHLCTIAGRDTTGAAPPVVTAVKAEIERRDREAADKRRQTVFENQRKRRLLESAARALGAEPPAVTAPGVRACKNCAAPLTAAEPGLICLGCFESRLADARRPTAPPASNPYTCRDCGCALLTHERAAGRCYNCTAKAKAVAEKVARREAAALAVQTAFDTAQEKRVERASAVQAAFDAAAGLGHPPGHPPGIPGGVQGGVRRDVFRPATGGRGPHSYCYASDLGWGAGEWPLVFGLASGERLTRTSTAWDDEGECEGCWYTGSFGGRYMVLND